MQQSSPEPAKLMLAGVFNRAAAIYGEVGPGPFWLFREASRRAGSSRARHARPRCWHRARRGAFSGSAGGRSLRFRARH